MGRKRFMTMQTRNSPLHTHGILKCRNTQQMDIAWRSLSVSLMLRWAKKEKRNSGDNMDEIGLVFLYVSSFVHLRFPVFFFFFVLSWHGCLKPVGPKEGNKK